MSIPRSASLKELAAKLFVPADDMDHLEDELPERQISNSSDDMELTDVPFNERQRSISEASTASSVSATAFGPAAPKQCTREAFMNKLSQWSEDDSQLLMAVTADGAVKYVDPKELAENRESIEVAATGEDSAQNGAVPALGLFHRVLLCVGYQGYLAHASHMRIQGKYRRRVCAVTRLSSLA